MQTCGSATHFRTVQAASTRGDLGSTTKAILVRFVRSRTFDPEWSTQLFRQGANQVRLHQASSILGLQGLMRRLLMVQIHHLNPDILYKVLLISIRSFLSAKRRSIFYRCRHEAARCENMT